MYQSLYRKYRPQNFDDVIGQEHITKTLKNQIELKRVGHAYLFTGSRGTGKTTCAKIFARAVSCQSPQNGSPCLKCSVCAAMNNAANLDIIEIDAASNNGVDEAREIKDSVNYLPSYSKYKVYIIDEAHMLTNAAFNALLKTLEEPPAHVLFILATTEPHKLPATILSRCMRFDFRLVDLEKISALLKRIFDSENKKYHDDAVKMIASLAEGSVRDALSIADMCINYSDILTLDDVLTLTGAAKREHILELLDALKNSDLNRCFLIVDSLYKNGKSISLICKEVCAVCRDLLVIKSVGAQSALRLSLIIDTAKELENLALKSEDYSAQFLQKILVDFSELDNRIRYSVSPRIILEAAIVSSISTASIDLKPPLPPLSGNIIKAADTSDKNIKSEETANKQENVVLEVETLENFNNILSDSPAQNNSDSRQESIQKTSDLKQESEPLIDVSNESQAAIFGRIITFVRKKNTEIFSYLKSGASIDIADEAVVLYANENNFLRLSEADSLELINEALKSLNINKTLIVKKRKSVNIDKTLERVQVMLGKDNVEIEQ